MPTAQDQERRGEAPERAGADGGQEDGAAYRDPDALAAEAALEFSGTTIRPFVAPRIRSVVRPWQPDV